MLGRKIVLSVGLLSLVSLLSLAGYFTYVHFMLDRTSRAGEFELFAQHLDTIPGLLEPAYTAKTMAAVKQALEVANADGVDPLLRQILTRSTWRKELKNEYINDLLSEHNYQALARLVSTPAFVRHGNRELFQPLPPDTASELVTFLELVSMEPLEASLPEWKRIAEWYEECKSDWCRWRMGELLAEPDSPLKDLVALERYVGNRIRAFSTELVGPVVSPAQQYLMARLNRGISPQDANRLLRQAAEGGNASALWRMAGMADTNSGEAESLLRASADAGHPLAMTLVALRTLAADDDPETALAALEFAALSGFDSLRAAVGRALLKGEPLQFPYGSWLLYNQINKDPILQSTALPRDPARGLAWLRRGVAHSDQDAARLLYKLQKDGEYGLDPEDHHTLAKYSLVSRNNSSNNIVSGNHALHAIRKAINSPEELMALAEQWHDLIEVSVTVERSWARLLNKPEHEEVLLAIAERHTQPARFLSQLIAQLKDRVTGHPATDHLLGRLTEEQMQATPELLAQAAAFAPLPLVQNLVELGAPVNPVFVPAYSISVSHMPLMAAIAQGRAENTLYLMEQGAELNTLHNRTNAVSLALNRGFTYIAKQIWDNPEFAHRTEAIEAELGREWAKWEDWHAWNDGLSFTFLDTSGRELSPKAPILQRQCLQDHATGLIWLIPTLESGPFAATRRIYGVSPDILDCNEDVCSMEDFRDEILLEKPCGIETWRLPETRDIRTLSFPAYRQAFPARPHHFIWISVDNGRLALADIDDLFGQRAQAMHETQIWFRQPPTSVMLVSGELSRWPSPLQLPDYAIFQLDAPKFVRSSRNRSESGMTYGVTNVNLR